MSQTSFVDDGTIFGNVSTDILWLDYQMYDFFFYQVYQMYVCRKFPSWSGPDVTRIAFSAPNFHSALDIENTAFNTAFESIQHVLYGLYTHRTSELILVFGEHGCVHECGYEALKKQHDIMFIDQDYPGAKHISDYIPKEVFERIALNDSPTVCQNTWTTKSWQAVANTLKI